MMAHHGFNGKHNEDSGSDEEDHDNDHHHDEHDRHHHHHLTAKTESGLVRNFNVYHHDPKEGTVPYHLHEVFLEDNGCKKMYHAYHYGSHEHKDEGRGSAYHWLNGTPVFKSYVPPLIALKSATPLVETDDEQPGSQKSSLDNGRCGQPKPSAPPADTRISSHHAGFYSSTSSAETNSREVTKEESCCSCTIL